MPRTSESRLRGVPPPASASGYSEGLGVLLGAMLAAAPEARPTAAAVEQLANAWLEDAAGAAAA